MKVMARRMVESEIDVKLVRVQAAVRYEDEDMPNNYPHRKGDMWDVLINVETGQILNWPKGVAPLRLHMKVTDCGSYSLIDGAGQVIASIDQNYVPGCFPGEHCGDYLIFDIDGAGNITNWKIDADEMVGNFFKNEED